MNIVVTFYTPSDDFDTALSPSEAREWLKSQGWKGALVRRPDGTVEDQDLDDIDDAALPHTLAAGVLKHVEEAPRLLVRHGPREYLAIRTSVVEAVGARVEEEDEGEDQVTSDYGTEPWMYPDAGLVH